MMTMMTASGLACLDDTLSEARRLDLPCEIRVGEGAYPCRVTALSAMGAEIDLGEPGGAGAAFAAEVAIVIPSLGQYKARRLWASGTRATYLFGLTEFSRRALGALIADRFPD